MVTFNTFSAFLKERVFTDVEGEEEPRKEKAWLLYCSKVLSISHNQLIWYEGDFTGAKRLKANVSSASVQN